MFKSPESHISKELRASRESAYTGLDDQPEWVVRGLEDKPLLRRLGNSKFVQRVGLLLALLTASEAEAKSKFNEAESHESAKDALVEVINVVRSKPDASGTITLNGRIIKMFEKNIGVGKKIHTNDMFSFIREEKQTKSGGVDTLYSVDANNDGRLDEVVLVPGQVLARTEVELELGFAGENKESIGTEVSLAGMKSKHSSDPALKRVMYFKDVVGGRWFGANFATGEVVDLSQETVEKQQAAWETRVNVTAVELKGSEKGGVVAHQ